MLTLQTKSTDLPLSLEAIKAHTRIIGTDDDDYLTELIWSASDYIEHHANRSYVQSTWVETFSDFPHKGERLELSRSPLVSVSSVTYFDTNALSRRLRITRRKRQHICQVICFLMTVGR